MTNLNTIINNANIDTNALMKALHEMPWSDIRSMAKKMGVSLTLKKGESRRIVEGRIADAIIATTAAVNTTETAATVETTTVNETVTTAETTNTAANALTDSVKKGVLIAWGDATFIEKDGFVARGKGDGYALFFRATVGSFKGSVISLKNRLEKATVQGLCEGLGKTGLNTAIVDKYVRRAVQIMADNGYCHVCQKGKDWYVHMNDQELKKFWEDYREVKTK